MNKKQLRKIVLSERKKLSIEDITEKSSKIVEYIKNSELFKKSKYISCYYPFKNEVDLMQLLSFTDKIVLFPRVVPNSKMLDFYSANKFSDFEKGTFDVMEPKINLQKIEVKDIDLFLTPGVAFSVGGERIGYGGGYYDTTLQKRNSNAKVLGICFDMQIIEGGFSDSWDQKLDGLITESKFYKF
jgi:5-formyltetrahydrofolate cyclo-ligase